MIKGVCLDGKNTETYEEVMSDISHRFVYRLLIFGLHPCKS